MGRDRHDRPILTQQCASVQLSLAVIRLSAHAFATRSPATLVASVKANPLGTEEADISAIIDGLRCSALVVVTRMPVEMHAPARK